MNKEDKFDRIEKYIVGTMSEQERAIFEQDLQSDSALQAELRLHQEVESSLKGEEIHEFRNVLKSVDAEWEAKPSTAKVRRLNYKRYISIAAAIAFLVIAIQYFIKMVPSDAQLVDRSPTELFETYHETYAMVLNQRSATDEESPITEQLNQAVQAYETQDYQGAAAIFQTLKKEETTAGIFYFYAALSELSAGNSSAAIPLFEKLNQDAPALYVEQSRWYLALAYLKSNNVAMAKTTLIGIKKGTFKYQEATKLLQSL